MLLPATPPRPLALLALLAPLLAGCRSGPERPEETGSTASPAPTSLETDRRERAAFRLAVRANTAVAFEDFLERYPEGPFTEPAREALEEITAERATSLEGPQYGVDQDELEAFVTAVETGTAEAHRAFAAAYPDGKLAVLALRAAESLEEREGR